MKCEKCEKEGKAYALRWKSLRMRAHFWTAHNVKIWRYGCLWRRPCALFALLGAAAVVLIVLDADFTALRLHLRSVLRQVLALCSLLPWLKCEKWKGRQSIRITLKEFENVSAFLNCTECEDMVISQGDHVLYLLRCSLSYSLFSTWTSQHWGCIYALSSPPFSCQALAFFFAPITTFAILTLWKWDC